MKKFLCLGLALVFSFSLTACGGRSVSSTPPVSGPSSSSAENTVAPNDGASSAASEESERSEVEENNILVAYFSHTGNTQEVAQMIAEYTGGDLAEIQRKEEYGNLQEEAKAEIDNGIQPEITVSNAHIEDYNTIFVGYPIWWDEAPAMIASFLAGHDFSGKTLIPFCTSASDDIENSLHIFSELCPDAVIGGSLTANDSDAIVPWLRELLPGGADGYESVEGTRIRMITANTEVEITLNGSRAAADLAAMLPLELTLIERERFAKGMTLPERLSSTEKVTRDYQIGDFGYWNAGPDLAIFYDDIYEQTIVEVIPLGHAESGAEALAGETGTVRLERIEP